MTFEETADWILDFVDRLNYTKLSTVIVGGKFSGVEFTVLLTESAKDVMDRCTKAWHWQADEFLLEVHNAIVLDWQLNKGHQRPPTGEELKQTEIIWWKN